jgi:hypothetical protein
MMTRRGALVATVHCRTAVTFIQRSSSGGTLCCPRLSLLNISKRSHAGIIFPQAQAPIMKTGAREASACISIVRRNLWSKSTREEEEKKKLGIISTTTNSNNNEDGVILFDRGSGRLRVMRLGFGFSSFHTAYWLWYSTCFVPAVNASTITEITIDPMLPTLGIVFSVIIQSIFTLYPRYLISRLTWSPSTNNVILYTHTVLPWIKADLNRPMKVVPVGELKLDAASKEAKQIISEYGGDLRRFKGHVGITTKPGQWPPFLLDFQGQATKTSSSSSSSGDAGSTSTSHHNDVSEPEILLEILFNPQAMIRDYKNGNAMKYANSTRRRNSANDDDDDPSWRVQVAREAAAVSRYKNKSKKTTSRQRGESQLRQIAKRRR